MPNQVQVIDTQDVITPHVGTTIGEINTINSKVIGEPAGSDVILNVVSLTQAEYDAGTKNPTTLYVIKN